MGRLIDAEDAKKALIRWVTGPTDEEIEYTIDRLPTVEAVPVVHGEWISDLDTNGKLKSVWRKCSVCGGLNYSTKPNFCPNCGADMRKD